MENRITPKEITELAENEIIVFGSNSSGSHLAGLATILLMKLLTIASEQLHRKK
jgi:hypothetical protein